MIKRGELTSTQIVSLIFAIVSFSILVYFLIVSNLKGNTEDEVCKLSVLTRATSPDIAQRLVPLKCRTKKICFSLGDDCKAFLGDKDVTNIKLPSNPEEAANKIEEISADALYTCWRLMGEGKLNLFAGIEKDYKNFISDFFKIDEAKPYCVMCSRLAVSENLKKHPEILSKVNLLDYMEKTKIKETGKTYVQTFTDKQVNSFPPLPPADFGNSKKQTDQIAITYMQLLVKDRDVLKTAYDKGVSSGLTVLIGGTQLQTLNPFGALSKGFGFKETAIAAIVTGGISGVSAGYSAWNNQIIAGQYCGEITGIDSEEQNLKYGCSVVAPLDFNNVESNNQLCTKIEGYEYG